MPSYRSLALVATLLCLAGPSQAADSSTIDAIEASPNIDTAGVSVRISGDDDGDATVVLRYRLAGVGATFVAAHPLSRLSGGRWVGSVFYLLPATQYELEVTLDDPDNAAPTDKRASLTTRADAPPPPKGKTIVVSASQGDDGHPGTAAEPKKTIAAALAVADPGDLVQVRAGIYREALELPRSGTPGAPIWVRADPGAVLDGSDATLAGSPSWTLHKDGIYWAPFSGDTDYVAVGDERIYHYTALSALEAESGGQSGKTGVLLGGFFVDTGQGRIYLRLPDRSSPKGKAVHVAALDRAILVDNKEQIVIDGFEIRYYGGQYGVGVDLRGARRTWVRNCHLHHLRAGVRSRKGGGENVIERNRLRDTSVYGWPWSSVKAHSAEASAISLSGGAGDIVRDNDIEGFFNGIATGQFGTTDEGIAANIDVYRNVMRQLGDDGLEPEGACVNQRFWENRINEVHNAISLAPIETGPVFFVRTVIVGYQAHALKINNGPTGYMYIYHTTAEPGPDPGAQAFAPSIPFGNLVARNNIWGAHRYVIEYGDSDLAGPVDMDYDNLYTDNADGGSRFVKWRGDTFADLAALAGGTGLESHGFAVRPIYEDLAGGDLTLVTGHALIDAGEPIPGINHLGIDGPPDVGAFERGGIAPGGDAGPVTADAGGPHDGGLADGPGADGPAGDGGTTHDGSVPGDGPPAGGGDGGSAEGGCGCRVSERPGALLLLPVLWLALRRRQR